MTIKPESNVGRQIMKNLPHAQLSRIENRHGGGIPDLYGIYGGQVIWLELKCIKQNSINITPTQISWNYNNFRHGGKNYYIVQDTRSKVLKLYDGDKGRELKEHGFLYGGHSLILPPPTKWEDLESFLFSPLPLEMRV